MPTRYVDCAVLGCDANSRDYPQLRYFSFPRNDKLFNEWIEAVKNPICKSSGVNRVKNRFRVCSRHFTDFQFRTIERRKLNRNQVPSIIDPFVKVFQTNAQLEALQATIDKQQSNNEAKQQCEVLDHDYERTICEDSRPSTPPTRNSPVILIEKKIDNGETIYTHNLRPPPLPVQRQKPPSKFTPLERQLKAELRRVKHDYAALKRYCKKRTLALRELTRKFKKMDLIEMIQDKELKQLENLSDVGELFFVSQIRNLSKKAGGRRYTPQELEFFVALYQKGPAAYRFLEKFFAIPSATTLKRAERIVVEHNYGIDAGCVLEPIDEAIIINDNDNEENSFGVLLQ